MNHDKSLRDYKIARVSTLSFSLISQLKKQLNDCEKQGMDITLISGCDDGMDIIENLNFKHHEISIARDISLLRDIYSLFQLYLFFIKNKFYFVHSITPKAGLLTSIAGWLARVPVRIHTFTGQAWANLSGFKRWVCIVMDKIIILLNNKVFADSNSQVEFLLENKVINNKSDIIVLGNGSLAGVDLQQFSIDKIDTKLTIRERLKIPENSFVFIFLGRLTSDKGIFELLMAFNKVVERYEHAYLLIVGPMDEKSEKKRKKLKKSIEKSKQIQLCSYSSQPELFLSAADVLCCPSHREGFGTVVIEAAALCIPAIGSDVAGLRDSIIHSVTGLLVEKGNIDELAECMILMIENEMLKNRLGQKAYQNVISNYSSSKISNLLLQEYNTLI